MRAKWAAAGDVALGLAAVVGALCIVVFVCALFFGMRIVLFSTGSMSPTIPAGSAALTRELPASEISVGDVVMVDRPGQLPITHRVVTIDPVDGNPDARRILMRGDANAVDDPFPYEVEKVGLVLVSVPGVAPAVSSLRSPWVLAGVTVAATALVVFVCWPRRRRPPPAEGEPPRTRREARARAGAASVAVLLAASLVAVPAPRAAADSSVTVIEGDVLRLVSIEDDEMRNLVPGRTVVWQVGVMAEPAVQGLVRVLLSSGGDAHLGLRYDVVWCPVQWQSHGCDDTQPGLPLQTIPVDGAERELATVPADEEVWLRVAVTMPSTTDPDLAGRVDIRVRAEGSGDSIVVDTGGGALAETGGDAAWLLAPLAFALTTAGALLARRARLHSTA